MSSDSRWGRVCLRELIVGVFLVGREFGLFEGHGRLGLLERVVTVKTNEGRVSYSFDVMASNASNGLEMTDPDMMFGGQRGGGCAHKERRQQFEADKENAGFPILWIRVVPCGTLHRVTLLNWT